LSFNCLAASVAQPSEKLSQTRTVTGRGSEKGPHGRFKGARIGGGHDGDEIVVRDLQDPSGFSDRPFKPLFAQGGAVGTADGGFLQGVKTPVWPLAAGARSEIGIMHGIILSKGEDK